MGRRNQQYNDPFEEIQEENGCLEDIPGLPIDQDGSAEDEDITVD